MAKFSFPKGTTEQQRSHGPRRRYKGRTVGYDGLPRSNNNGPGGNTPKRYGGGRKHTKLAPMFWERNGIRNAPPASWIRGWK